MSSKIATNKKTVVHLASRPNGSMAKGDNVTMIEAGRLRTCIVCAYLMEMEVIEPVNEVLTGSHIKCCWDQNPDLTGEACEACVHFANIHKNMLKGGDDDAFEAMAAHTKAAPIARNGSGKGKSPRSRAEGQEHATQLELDTDKAIRT